MKDEVKVYEVKVYLEETVEVEAFSEDEAAEKAVEEVREDGGYKCCFDTSVIGVKEEDK